MKDTKACTWFQGSLLGLLGLVVVGLFFVGYHINRMRCAVCKAQTYVPQVIEKLDQIQKMEVVQSVAAMRQAMDNVRRLQKNYRWQKNAERRRAQKARQQIEGEVQNLRHDMRQSQSQQHAENIEGAHTSQANAETREGNTGGNV